MSIRGGIGLLFTLLIVSGGTRSVSAQTPDQAISGLELRVSSLEQRVAAMAHDLRDRGGLAGVAFLFGAFCALWAQNTKRNPWLWFFLGL